MAMPKLRTQYLLFYVLLAFVLGLDLELLASKAKTMFYHGFNGYMKSAFPFDELAPISCTALGPDHSAAIPAKLHKKLTVNQPAHHEFRGGFCLTLIDALDTLAILGDVDGFHRAVDDVLRTVHSFDIDLELSVFELNIRVLGGLLSAHQFCAGHFGKSFRKIGYKNELLDLAVDLGTRLLPAFNTGTGIPVARVNLRTGVKTPFTSNNPAAGSTFLLEFGLLSALTGDDRFYNAAEKALSAVWEHRSELNLIGIEIDVETGEWKDPASTIGAGADSFHEYLLKAYILFGDPALLEVYQASSEALRKHQLDRFGNFRTVDCNTGRPRTGRMDALGAFYPGLLVLAGDIDTAKRSFDSYYLTAIKYSDGLLVEAFDVETRQVINTDYNLRPELIESAYYLYQATRDPFYLRVGERVLNLIEERCKTACGYARLQDAFDGDSKIDQSESFLLSETLKYLYLLFSPDHWISKSDKAIVFSTEAHPMIVPVDMQWTVRASPLYKCPLTAPTNEDPRLLQHWNAGLKSTDIDAYNDLWNAQRLMRPTISPSFTDLPAEVVPIPGKAFVLTSNFGIKFAKNVTLSAWPDIQSPSYTVNWIESEPIHRDEQIVMVLRRKRLDGEVRKTFGMLPTGNWFHFAFPFGYSPRPSQGKCSILMPLRGSGMILQGEHEYFGFKQFRKMVPLEALARSMIEEPSGAVYRGLPVKNLKFGFLVDYVFDHIMK